jgi:ABC-type antimicrobial peptide transport system permease subunit
VPVVDLRPMAVTVGGETAARRLAGGILGAFAVAALGVAALGVFALTLERVQRGAPVLGLRMALGARPIDLVLLVVRRSVALAVLGLVLGVGASRLLAPLLRARLFGVEPSDQRVVLVVAGLLGLAAVLACVAPAWRAARVDPVKALAAD